VNEAELRGLEEKLAALREKEAVIESEERQLWSKLGALERDQEGFQEKVSSSASGNGKRGTA